VNGRAGPGHEVVGQGVTGRDAARLDLELVRRGLARSRGRAAAMVRAGRVAVDGRPAARPSLPIRAGSDVQVRTEVVDGLVGRGALKLAAALDDLGAGEVWGGGRAEGVSQGPAVAGRRCLDAGASTGGFTQVLLGRGAAQVVAVDVGHGQLAVELGEDPRVTDLPGTTVRGLTRRDVGGPVDLLVADLSFISLRLVIDDLAGLVRPCGDLLMMVKPQFEVGRDRLGRGGVVRDPGLRRAAVEGVARAARLVGAGPRRVAASRFPGPGGNVEYFVWCTIRSDPGAGPAPGAGISERDLPDVVRQAVEEGPQ
jgi:23S rRNA (cytidine1920-2'-O)/16S rRNA (cytidine1409-2'-O)-methyltransferase